MKKQYDYLIPFLAAILIVIGLVTSSQVTDEGNDSKKNVNHKEKLIEVLDHILDDYVDDVDENEVVEKTIRSMLKDLDPHSVYIPAKDLQRANEPLDGQFEGIGIEFDIMEDTITVVSPISGGPSEELGIRSGDKIVKIEGKVVAGTGVTNQDVIESLRGEKGTEVTVHIKRRGSDELLDFTITRDQIPIYSVDASYMIDDKSGYIKVNRFSSSTLREFMQALNELQEEGMENLVLDLRNNPGGYLNASIQMADQFLDNNQKIVYTEGRSRPKQTFNASRRGNHKEGKLSVMINGGSASASEIVSGAVQDWDRGIVVGRRSFGKGLVQEPFELKDGSAVRLTVSRYYTPTGRSIQRPYDMDRDEYRREVIERFNDGELHSRDSTHFPDSLKFSTPKGRTVYGGGGIMPDLFVPIDTTFDSDYFRKIDRQGITRRFGFQYVDNNRDELKGRYSDFSTFSEQFNAADLKDEFVAFAEENDVEYDEKGWEKSGDNIKNRYKASIARQLFDSEHAIRVRNEKDNVYLRAVESLYDGTFEEMGLE